MVDQLCQKNTTDESCKCCRYCPDHCPCKNSYECIGECDGRSACKHIFKIPESHPCKQIVWRHMIHIIISKCHTGHENDRYDIHHDNADTWQGKQCDIELTVEKRFDILTKCIDMLSLFLHELKAVNSLHVAYI